MANEGLKRGHPTDISGAPISETKERIYVVVTGVWGDHDVVGCSVTADRDWFSHVSSYRHFLIRDCTDGFRDRREQLEAAYPDGYEVVLIDVNDELPDEIAHWFTKAEPDV